MAPTDEGRSMRSEYDYGSKKKFVDVLGNIKKDGLANLAEFKNHEGNKNMESTSQKSRLTAASLASYNRRNAAMKGHGADQMTLKGKDLKKPIKFNDRNTG